MIAHRTLMFTQKSVAWECRQGWADSETTEFKDETDGTVVGCDKDGWVPPTHPNAMFAFFRDWRLPPRDTEDITSEQNN
jgi:hypothetical protein